MYLLELAGEDDSFAAREAECAATDVRVRTSGLATATTIDPDRIRGLAFTHRASRAIDSCPSSIRAAASVLVGTSFDRRGSVRVRARDVRRQAGIDTAAAERTLGRALVEHGFSVDLEDPDHELRALFTEDRCWLGWLVMEADRDFAARKPTDKPFFQPGSMDPPLARAIVNIAGAGPERTLLDPMCGTGGMLIEAGLVGAMVVGFDVQSRMVEGSVRNFERYLPADRWAVGQADAGRLPVRDGVVDAVVFDAPYGRQSKISGSGQPSLIARALAEAARVASTAVVVSDRQLEPLIVDTQWDVTERFDRRVHRSLTRYIHVLNRAPTDSPADR